MSLWPSVWSHEITNMFLSIHVYKRSFSLRTIRNLVTAFEKAYTINDRLYYTVLWNNIPLNSLTNIKHMISLPYTLKKIQIFSLYISNLYLYTAYTLSTTRQAIYSPNNNMQIKGIAYYGDRVSTGNNFTADVQ